MSQHTNKRNDDQEQNKTVMPDQTVLSSPEIAPTMKGGDTVEDVDPQATLKPQKAALTMKADDSGQSESGNSPSGNNGTMETFISDPNHDGLADATNQATVISDPNLADGTGKGGNLNKGHSRKDLEDHYETLVEDSRNPAKSPKDAGGMIIGDYQVLSELGRGGMGVVYKARHRKLNRIVALKMILAGPHAGNEALERFIVEARAVAHLQHPGIVQIFDIGEHEGLPYFSLEYVEGCDLQDKLDRQPQDPIFAAKMVEKLARAMQYAHENNILHRDIKPPNVLLDANGNPKITDFGLAKQVDGEDASTGTTAGTIMGSPSYMPPEQARGEISSVTPRSDLYSLGAVLYEMLTGRPPFLAKKPLETVMQVVNIDPVAPRDLQPEIPVDIETICLKAMQKEQSARYSSCHELAEDLKRFLDSKPILARPVSKLERLVKWCKRNPKIAVPSGLATFAIAATAVIASWAWQATSALAADLKDEKDNVTVQRDEAEKQRALAEEAQKKAEENEAAARKQSIVALQSIQFVLTNVDKELAGKPQLEEVRLAVLEALSDKWDEIDVELTGGEQGEAAATLMSVRKQIADIYRDVDKLKEADEEYEKLYQAGKRRIEVKNGSDSSRFNLARICLGWAPVKKRASNTPDAAIKLQEEANALMEDIEANPRPEPGSPGPIQLMAARAQILQNTGVEYLHSGLLDKTAENFAAALKLNERLVAAIPQAEEFHDKEPQRSVYLTHFKGEIDRGYVGLGYIQLRREKTEEALPLYDKGIEGSRAKLLAKPDDVTAKAALGGYLDMLGEAYLWLERPADAESPIKEANKLLKDAHQSDPNVARTTRALGNNFYHLATLGDLQSKPDEKRKAGEACRDLFADMVKNTPDRKNKFMLMLAEAKLGNADKAQPLIDEFGKTEEPDTEAHLDRARALAQLSRAADDGEDKQAIIGEALTAIERCVKDGYSDPFRLTHDNDLKPIRQEPRFLDAIESIRK